MRRLWQKVYERLGDPKVAQKVHGWGTIIWFLASVPIAVIFGSLVVVVTWLSLYAIVVAHWSSWQAARTEVAQDEASKRLHELVKRLRKLDPDDPEDDAERE